MILAGDIGGTKARLALYDIENGKPTRQLIETFVSSDFTSLEAVASNFLYRHNTIVTKACFGVPGPVINGQANAPNLPWELKEKQIANALRIDTVKLVNDLVATTAAIPYFTPDKLLTLYKGERDKQDQIYGILAPGTGLGQGFLNNKPGHYYIMGSEGGHADFAPTTDIEIELLKYLNTKFERVSYERVLSGKGLINIYTFLKDAGYAPEHPELSRRLSEEDPAAVISTTGQAGKYEICVKALDIFASVLGAQAGNLVLTLMATGGIYLGGGIPPKICKKLADGTTAAAYVKKGRLSDLVKATPLYVIRDDHAALLGAAYLASKL